MNEGKLRDVLRQLGVQVVEKSAAGWLHSTCPFAPWTHASGSDRRPSFGCKIEEGGVSSYVCFSCHAHGRISGMVRNLHDYGHDVGDLDVNDYPALAHEADAADRDGAVENPFEVSREDRDPPPDPLDEVLYEGMYERAWDVAEARQYCEGRGLGLPTSETLGLVWDPDQRRVLFPVRDRAGGLYGWTGRAIDPLVEPKIRDYAGLAKRHLILGENLWRGERPLIIVEGLFALAHLIELNVTQVADVGALLGSVMTEQKAERIRVNDQPVYLFLDNDPAGDAGLFGRIHMSGDRDFHSSAVGLLYKETNVYIPHWPEGKIDPDELTKRDVWQMMKHSDIYGVGRII